MQIPNGRTERHLSFTVSAAWPALTINLGFDHQPTYPHQPHPRTCTAMLYSRRLVSPVGAPLACCADQ